MIWVNALDSATTTPDKPIRPIKLGMAINPLKTSAMDHTNAKFSPEPNNTEQVKTTR